MKVPAEFMVDERTLFSGDVYKEIAQIHFNVKYGHKARQGDGANLSAFFMTMSALRHQLRKIVGSEKADYGEDIKEYLKRQDDEKRFERDLLVMIGNVCPRALSARFQIRQ